MVKALLFILLATATSPIKLNAASQQQEGFPYVEKPLNLLQVARRFQLSVDDIAKANNIKDPNLFYAYGLILPETSSTQALPRFVPWKQAAQREHCNVDAWQLRPLAEPLNCDKKYCGNGPKGQKACLCIQNDGSEKSGSYLSISDVNGKREISINVASFNPREADVFDISTVDLDGDSKDEILVGWLYAVSNGVGESFRSLVMIAGDHEMLRYDSGEFSARDAVLRVNGACHLASAHLEEIIHPLRGPALYLVERTFDPLMKTMDKKLVGRRFSDRIRYELPDDPLTHLSEKPLQENGTIAAKRDQGTFDSLEFKTKNSKHNLDEEVSDASRQFRIGDAASHRAFPAGFGWSYLNGKPAIAIQYPWGRILWIAK